eukprot:6418568-Pyramimonas_sp.AAC.1
MIARTPPPARRLASHMGCEQMTRARSPWGRPGAQTSGRPPQVHTTNTVGTPPSVYFLPGFSPERREVHTLSILQYTSTTARVKNPPS